jgi:hypothetical protein
LGPNRAWGPQPSKHLYCNIDMCRLHAIGMWSRQPRPPPPEMDVVSNYLAQEGLWDRTYLQSSCVPWQGENLLRLLNLKHGLSGYTREAAPTKGREARVGGQLSPTLVEHVDCAATSGKPLRVAFDLPCPWRSTAQTSTLQAVQGSAPWVHRTDSAERRIE